VYFSFHGQYKDTTYCVLWKNTYFPICQRPVTYLLHNFATYSGVNVTIFNSRTLKIRDTFNIVVKIFTRLKMGHNCKNIIDITYTTPFFYYCFDCFTCKTRELSEILLQNPTVFTRSVKKAWFSNVIRLPFFVTSWCDFL
jgi:hypothetical protein